MNRRIVRLGLVAAAAAAVIAIGLSLRPASNSGAKAASVARPASSPSPSPVHVATMGKLAYALNGDVYLANWDGSDPVRIANGGIQGLHVWSPDGRYLAYGGETGNHNTLNISDAQGHLVASVPQVGSDAIAWSPDSQHIAAWASGRAIGIFSLHGVREKLLRVPPGQADSDFAPGWSPDGASIVVPGPRYWRRFPFGLQIPLDGSRPRQLPAGDPRSQWGYQYSPDGSRVAYSDGYTPTNGGRPCSWLDLATANGSGARVLVPHRVYNAAWSPSGDQIAFYTPTSIGLPRIMGPSGEIGVVDVSSGKLTKLIAVGDGGVIGFSPDGRLVLFWRTDSVGASSLWAVGTDGSRPTHLVTGTDGGEWQPMR